MPRRFKGPGPGQYDIPNGFGAAGKTKAYSMRGKPEGGVLKELCPGPAEYEPKTGVALKSSAKWGFGTSKRIPMGGAGAPGPGEYTPSDPNVVSARANFGTAKRPDAADSKNRVPGPGAYNPLRVSDTVNRGKTILGTRMGNLGDLNSPGPAAYNQGTKIQAKKLPSWGFGTAPRHTDAAHGNLALKNPGPGTYQLPPSFHGPKISITPRREDPYSEF